MRLVHLEALSWVLFVAGLIAGAILTTRVEGVVLSPWAVYWLTVALTVIGGVQKFLPGMRRRR